MLLGALLALACGGGTDEGTFGGGSGEDDEEPDGLVTLDAGGGSGEADADAADADAFSCTPEEPICLGAKEWAKCSPSGSAYGLVHECAQSFVCEPGEGRCIPAVCEPNARECRGHRSYRVCGPYGGGWSEDQACPDDQVCVEGACQTCRPGEPTCVDLDTRAECNADGTDWTNPSACPGEQRCHGPSGTCRDVVCEAGDTRCVNAVTYQECLPSGTGWSSQSLECVQQEGCEEPGQCLCTEGGKCLYEECLPERVLLVVDRSGSMGGFKWGAVRASVTKLLEDNPEARFGLLPFPTPGGGACTVTDTPPIEVTTHSAEKIQTWFYDNLPNGATPLARTIQELVGEMTDILGNAGGSIIVLTDGQDTCSASSEGAPVAEALGKLADKLWQDHSVKTYVVGFQHEGASSQLQALAENGHTDRDDWIRAGDEEELVGAFEAVIQDFKQCVNQ